MKVDVEHKGGSYPVHIVGGFGGFGAALADTVQSRSVVVVSDTNVAPLWADPLEAELVGAGFQVHRVVMPAGEVHKHRDTWWGVVDGVLSAGVDRRTPLIALGGGVVGDVAGFAAASVLRGMPFVQVPTTVLSMVDSSVGGKTGFNHPSGKNLVGAFHQPMLVWAALDTLSTLDPRQRRAGLGEVVKAALIDDAALFERLETRAEHALGDDLESVVAACVASKARVVALDERERGLRAILNAGHTVAHAVEVVAGYGEWLHGEAVAIGLVAETGWSERVGYCREAGLGARVRALCVQLGMPVDLPELSLDRLEAAMSLDKKGVGDTLTVPAPVRVGEVRLVSMPLASVRDLLGPST